jgi:hypothetical protein
MTGSPAVLAHYRLKSGCPTLAASLFLRLGWESAEPFFAAGTTRKANS